MAGIPYIRKTVRNAKDVRIFIRRLHFSASFPASLFFGVFFRRLHFPASFPASLFSTSFPASLFSGRLFFRIGEFSDVFGGLPEPVITGFPLKWVQNGLRPASQTSFSSFFWSAVFSFRTSFCRRLYFPASFFRRLYIPASFSRRLYFPASFFGVFIFRRLFSASLFSASFFGM